MDDPLVTVTRDIVGGNVEDFRIHTHLEAVLTWILQAYQAGDTGGISKGYSILRKSWSASYPETTGYTIPTLLNVAQMLNRDDLRDSAIRLADYLLECTTVKGGVSHYKEVNEPSPLVFDTGQVIFGWLAVYVHTGSEVYLDAAQRAGDWLVSIQDPSGLWKEGQHLGVEKVIDTRVSWALLELHRLLHKDSYLEAAIRNLEWACAQQEQDGWFQHCALVMGEDPITHTLAYTIEGLLECGRILQEARYLTAAKLTSDALLHRQRPDGSLASSFRRKWKESSRSSCLTGNCQFASIWFHLYQRTGQTIYHDAARKAVIFVAKRQDLKTINKNIFGGIPGSSPIYGRYERFKYPNWAAKFFADALLDLDGVEQGTEWRVFIG